MYPRVAWSISLLALIGAAGLFSAVKLRPISGEEIYVGSETCKPCHGKLHADWSESQHTRMMRRIDEPGVVIADFSADDVGLQFDENEIEWIIGGKWEQQFMGLEDQRETLLPGVWLASAERWDFKGWDGWQVPDPVTRCHGCHTVGFNAESGEFVEPNIGCESCHGPGEWHVRTLGVGRIYASDDAQVCGQCHARGESSSGEFFFPVGYRPGQELDESFVYSEPSANQNSSFWYGNGHERRRHQEYLAWRGGGHAKSLEHLLEGYDGRYGSATDECLACHSGEYILAPSRNKPSLADVRSGVTCSVCHNVHGGLNEIRTTCDRCHDGGASYHQPSLNASHVPCPEEANVSCVSCHMPQTIQIGGAYKFHDHSSGVVPPADTLKWGTPSSCSQSECHAQLPTEILQNMFESHYLEPKRETDLRPLETIDGEGLGDVLQSSVIHSSMLMERLQ